MTPVARPNRNRIAQWFEPPRVYVLAILAGAALLLLC